MLLNIPELISAAQVQQARRILDAATWVDGNVTSGHQSAKAKHNEQVPEDHPAAREVGAMILQALNANALFFSAALPKHVFPPLFNRYGVGQGFRTHVDNAVRRHRASGMQLRTDLSATLFLSAPDDYDGGELVIDDTYGTQRIKLPAGHLLLYPSTSLHQVMPITRGSRLASFFWIQSMVRDDGERRVLFDLDNAIRRLGSGSASGSDSDSAEHAVSVPLTGVYHNLLRRWADV